MIDLLMRVKALPQAIVDLLLDIMVECCQPSEWRAENDPEANSLNSPGSDEASSSLEPIVNSELSTDYARCNLYERLGLEFEGISNLYAVQSSLTKTHERQRSNRVQSIFPPEISARDQPPDNLFIQVPKVT